MFYRSFDITIVNDLITYLDNLNLEYEINEAEYANSTSVEFYFKDESDMFEASKFECSEHVKSIVDVEEKRNKFIHYVSELKLLMTSEVNEFAQMCGYIVLAKV